MPHCRFSQSETICRYNRGGGVAEGKKGKGRGDVKRSMKKRKEQKKNDKKVCEMTFPQLRSEIYIYIFFFFLNAEIVLHTVREGRHSLTPLSEALINNRSPLFQSQPSGVAPIWLLVVTRQPEGSEGHVADRFDDHLFPCRPTLCEVVVDSDVTQG